MFNYSFVQIIKIIIKSKYVFAYPEKKKILIYDSDSYEYLDSFFKKRDIHVFDVRHTTLENQKINLRILFDLIFEFKFTKKNYIKRYFSYVKPKIVITTIDNNLSFYLLKNYYKFAKYITIQNAMRSTKEDIFADLKKMKKSKAYQCDYVLVFNQGIGKLYKSFCSAKIVVIGSVLSNLKPKTFKKKYDLVYISTFRSGKDNEVFINNPRTTFGDYRKKEIKLIKNISYFANNNSLNLSVLGAKFTIKDMEQEFFNNLIGTKNFTFIPRLKNRKTYKIIDESKLIISTDSTLGYEAASRGNKVCFFSVRGNKKRLNSSNFGWPIKKRLVGKFWSNKVTSSEIKRVVNFLNKKNTTKIIQKEMRDILFYDPNNNRLRKFLNHKINE